MLEEVWKDITGYEGLYQVSNMGRVKTLEKRIRVHNGFRVQQELIIKPILQKSGYAHVGLWKNSICRQNRLHRLVAEAFCTNDAPHKKKQVNHINEDKLDNRACNLEWVTAQQNTLHGSCLKRRARTKNSSKEILQCSFDGKVLRTFPNERQATLYCTGKNAHGEIRKVCLGKQLTAFGYKWRYVKKEVMPNDAEKVC